jgi:hypothetical protein
MAFLRRMLGGKDEQPTDAAEGAEPRSGERWPRGSDDQLTDDEAERERALLRADAERLDDELLQRQLRYADRSWTPAAQGGERRADDDSREDG